MDVARESRQRGFVATLCDMSTEAPKDEFVTEILERAEKNALRQVARDQELIGPIDEAEITQRVKDAPSEFRGTLVFSLVGAKSVRKAWEGQGRLALGEAYAQMILRSIACYMSSKDLAELVGVGRAFGESEALMKLVLGVDGE